MVGYSSSLLEKTYSYLTFCLLYVVTWLLKARLKGLHCHLLSPGCAVFMLGQTDTTENNDNTLNTVVLRRHYYPK